MSSMLSSFFSRDPKSQFPFELVAESFALQNGIYMGHSHRKADPTSKATCFWSQSNASTLRTQTQKLKTLRHPNVLTFLDSIEADNTFYLVTEPCVPIQTYFENTELNDAQKELVVSWGLYQVLSTLKFLHNEAKINQNNIHESIFVTQSGDWKLSGFHQTEPFSNPKPDLNGLSELIWHIFNGFDTPIPQSKTLTKIPRRLHGLFKKFDSKTKAFPAGDLLSESRAAGGFMKNKFVDTLLFLDEFQLKDSAEKQAFFMNLKDNLGLFPDNIAKYKILPKLIHTYEFGDAGSHILVPMFRLGKLLDEAEYQQRIVPCLVKLFSSPDRSTRVRLLEKIDEFAPHLNQQVVNDKIYGNLITGFLDSNPAVRESTVKAMVVFAEKLNYNNLNMDLMKYMARLQGSDDQPGIRTNTTICLGKIGSYLDPSHRQRILSNAFTRALKDPFPPARMAGVLALSATQQFYALAEVANRILPALAPLALDPDKQVRDNAFKATRNFLEKLEKASDNPDLIPELEAQVKAGGGGGILSTDKWAGWALKALSGKFYKGTVPTATPSTTTSPATTANPTANGQAVPAAVQKPGSPAFADPPSKPASSRASTTSSPDLSRRPDEPAAKPRPSAAFAAKPAKKPLVLKKPVKKDDFLFAEDPSQSNKVSDWGAEDDLFDLEPPKPAPPQKPEKKVAPRKQTTPPKSDMFAMKEEEKAASDDDWDTQW